MTRRQVLRALAAMPISFAGAVRVTAQANRDVAYGGTTLPAGIRSRFINVNGITQHILEAGFESPAPASCSSTGFRNSLIAGEG